MVGSRTGKVELVKSYLLRQAVFGRRAGSSTRKASTAGSPKLSGYDRSPLAGRYVRLNPLTPRGGPERQLNLLYAVAAAALERPLTPEEKRAGQEAPSSSHDGPTASRPSRTSSMCSSTRRAR